MAKQWSRLAALHTEEREAPAMPDITVTGGVRRHEFENDYSFAAGLSVPLPVSSQNQSGIVEAGRRLEQAEFQLGAAKTHVLAAINDNDQKLTSAAAEIEIIQKTLIPSCENAISALHEGYRVRKLRLSEMLIAEQALTALWDGLLMALGSYHQSYADVEQLLGDELYGRPSSKLP